MGRVIETLCLNGKDAGKIHRTVLQYTEKQEEKAKKLLEFSVEGVLFAGWCSECNRPILKGKESYLSNVDGRGYLQVDVLHKYCL